MRAMRFVLIPALFMASAAAACTIEQVAVTDFTPSAGSWSDGNAAGLQLSGGINNFCDQTLDVTLQITERGSKGGSHGPYYMTVKNVPPGGKGFDTMEGIPFAEGTKSVAVEVSAVQASPQAPDSVERWPGAPEPNPTSAYNPYPAILHNSMYNAGRSLAP